MSGVTDDGFEIKKLPEIKEEMEGSLRAAFSQNVKTEARSVNGNLIAILSDRIASLWELAGEIYSSAFTGTATGVQLDRNSEGSGTFRLEAKKSTVNVNVTVDAADTFNPGDIEINDGSNGATVWSLKEQLVASGAGTFSGVFEASVTGPEQALAETLNEIVTAPSSVTAVLNSADAELGRLLETDSELRERVKTAKSSGTGSSVDGLRNKVLEVTDVTAAIVYENTSDSSDSAGRPAHSVQVVVDGGTDADVAAAIWANNDGGTEMFGANSVNVIDANGRDQTVKFDRIEGLDLWVKVQYTPGARFADGGETLISKEIVLFGDTLPIGRDILPFLILQNIETQGIDSMTVLVGTTLDTVAESRLVLNPTQRPRFDTLRIVFEVI